MHPHPRILDTSEKFTSAGDRLDLRSKFSIGSTTDDRRRIVDLTVVIRWDLLDSCLGKSGIELCRTTVRSRWLLGTDRDSPIYYFQYYVAQVEIESVARIDKTALQTILHHARVCLSFV